MQTYFELLRGDGDSNCRHVRGKIRIELVLVDTCTDITVSPSGQPRRTHGECKAKTLIP